MWNKISNGWALAANSWQLLCQDKKLVVFPLLSGACSFLVILVFCVPFLAHPALLDFPQDAQGHMQVPLWVYPALFAFYFGSSGRSVLLLAQEWTCCFLLRL